MTIKTITLGIPAYNEEKNLAFAVSSVLRQKLNKYKLEKIIVVSGGSTDHTNQIVRNFSKTNPVVHLTAVSKRRGKVFGLNKLHRLNESDFLVTMDADVVFKGTNDLEELIKELDRFEVTSVVASHETPVKAKNFIEKVNNTGHRLWDETRLHVNGGNHIHNLRGSCSALKKEFAKKLKYPADMTCDQGFLYLSAVRNNPDGFRYAFNSCILFRSPSSLYECKLLGTRAIFEDKQKIADYFGKQAFKAYQIPLIFKIRALLKMMRISPLYTTYTILLGLYVRLVPLDITSKNGMWMMVTTTKQGIEDFTAQYTISSL